ncbi:hypothetical protein BDK61_4303 [Haloarcula quadrata]|uniref:DUF1102 domain-containing protein n=1 Tax=Haloarcula quadrata TaxID=182779 RepID=A0A495QQL6_9EURY|nr:hypothetical protein [Haloarcula quadrata]RKS75786.1 hypothetical protein BDK61_4303 [Haloarcula quadrata]
MNRRNVLTGLGGLAISGGALFGTGAFTSVSATRSVEVNVFGDSGGTTGLVDDANSGEEANIAETITGGSGEDETGGAVDVLINTANKSISVAGPDGGGVSATTLFPSAGSIYGNAIGTEYVSLVANDVTIVFGDEQGLPPSSSVGFSNLFAFVPNTNGTEFDVRFESDAAADASLLTEIGGTGLNSDDDTSNDPSFTISGVSKPNGQSAIESGSITEQPASVDTTTSDNTSQTLDITIE